MTAQDALAATTAARPAMLENEYSTVHRWIQEAVRWGKSHTILRYKPEPEVIARLESEGYVIDVSHDPYNMIYWDGRKDATPPG